MSKLIYKSGQSRGKGNAQDGGHQNPNENYVAANIRPDSQAIQALEQFDA